MNDPRGGRQSEPERRQRILADASRLLLDYVGPDEAEPLRRIVHKVVEAMGDWCAFALVDAQGILRNVAAYHPDPKQRELEKRVNLLLPPGPWNAGPPETNSLVQHKPIVAEEITDEMLRASGMSEEAFLAVKEIGLTSAIVAPMFEGAAPLGTLLLATTSAGGRRYAPDDIDFVVSLAELASLGVRNARLVRQLAQERDLQRVARGESDRRAAELTAVIDSDPNGIALFDAEGRLSAASRNLEALLGLPLRAMLGQPFTEIYRQELEQVVSTERERLFDRVQEHFADKTGSATDHLELERPRQRWVTRTTVPVTGAGGEYLGRLFVYADVSEQRELDRQRSDFLTVAAHELRTPLTPLSMYLQSIERRLLRGQEVEPELVGKARRQVVRLARLVEDLLDVSRLESQRLQLSLERLRIDELAEQVVNDFRGNGKNHELVFQRPAVPLFVEGDRARLEQVLVKLLGNAIKYSPQGGQVVTGVARAGDEVKLWVTDPGIGVPAEEQDKLFQRFFRARNATTRHYGGLGIGLYVSAEIVRRHGGHFEVRSGQGEGSTFTVFLPLAAALAGPQPTRVLLVDDDPDILAATSQLLREWGYSVDEARDGQTALALARGAKPDLLLVDLMMPVMDGATLVGLLRGQDLIAGVPLVVFSADQDAEAKSAKLHADAMLRKPFSLEALQEVLERLVPGKPAAASA